MLVLPGAVALVAFSALAQEPPIVIEQSTLISAEDPQTPHVESWLARNPTNPRNSIAVANAMAGHAQSETALYFTKDAGQTWHRARTSSGGHYFQGTDPSLTFAPDGTAYYVNEDASRIYFYRSSDGGETWSAPLSLAGDDHPVVIVDSSPSKYRDRLYVAASGNTFTAQGEQGSSIEFAYSDDGGLTFHQRAFLIQKQGHENHLAWPSITDLLVTADGTVVLMYSLDVQATEGKLPTSVEHWVMTSSNGGQVFTEPHRVTTASAPSDDARALKTAYFAKMAVDNSFGPRRGRLFLAYLDIVDGWSRTKVTHSDDLGQTWGESVLVASDASHSDQAIPAIAVSESGIVGVAWYDRRNDPQNDCFQGYFAASVDGGLSFLSAVPLQKNSTCPKVPGNGMLHGAYSRVDGGRHIYSAQSASGRFPNGGETQGLVAFDSERFLLAWTNGESGVMQFVSSLVRVNAQPLGHDMTDRTSVTVGRPEWDLVAHSISVPVSITNTSRLPLQGPFHLVMDRFGSIFGELHPSNARSGPSTVAPVWELPLAPGKNMLAPGETTPVITLRFDIRDVPAGGPAKTDDAELDLVFRVFDGFQR